MMILLIGAPLPFPLVPDCSEPFLLPPPGSTYKFRVVAMNMYGESPHSIPSKLYQVPQASPRITERPVVGPHILSTDAISDTQIMLRWTVSPAPLTHPTQFTSSLQLTDWRSAPLAEIKPTRSGLSPSQQFADGC